jgi:hypothetical protein
VDVSAHVLLLLNSGQKRNAATVTERLKASESDSELMRNEPVA